MSCFLSIDLGWAISTGPDSRSHGISDLRDSVIGISRIGRYIFFEKDGAEISGSYVMPYVLADQNSWLDERKEPFTFKVLNTFDNLISSVRYDYSSKIQKSN